MNIVVPILLAVLVLLDGCFSGFRAAAGRDARTAKSSYARAAARQGTLVGAVVLVVLAAACLVALGADRERYDGFVAAGGRMLWVLCPYGILVLAALVGYVSAPQTGVQTLMSTVVLGPFTLVRPLVVLAAILFALPAGDRVVLAVAVLSGALVLAVEPVLRRLPPPNVPPTPPPWAASRPSP